MNNYKVMYIGISRRFAGFEKNVYALSKREAVIEAYKSSYGDNFFPQEDGSVRDCDGYVILGAGQDNLIYGDAGYFYAELINN